METFEEGGQSGNQTVKRHEKGVGQGESRKSRSIHILKLRKQKEQQDQAKETGCVLGLKGSKEWKSEKDRNREERENKYEYKQPTEQGHEEPRIQVCD